MLTGTISVGVDLKDDRSADVEAAVTLITGFVVTDTSDDTITVTNSAGSTSVTYTIVIVGTSA